MTLNSQVVLTTISIEELTAIIEKSVRNSIAQNYLAKETVTKEYLNRKQVAKLLGIAMPTLHRYTLQGKLIAHRIGSRVLYKPCEVEAALSTFRKHN